MYNSFIFYIIVVKYCVMYTHPHAGGYRLRKTFTALMQVECVKKKILFYAN